MIQNNRTKKDQKLKRRRMLKTWEEYSQILSQGKKIEDKDIALSLFRKREKSPKLGILVPKRIGKSVKRNRIKRLLRESYRLNQELFCLDLDIIVKAKRDISHLAFGEIEANLIKLMERY